MSLGENTNNLLITLTDRSGFRLIELHHSQNNAVAASMIAEKAVSGHRSKRGPSDQRGRMADFNQMAKRLGWSSLPPLIAEGGIRPAFWMSSP